MNHRAWTFACAFFFAIVSVTPSASAAETVHLFLRVAGNTVDGESSKKTLGRKNSIECFSYEQAAATTRGAGMTLAKRKYEVIKITKPIDKSSPLLVKAMARDQPVTAMFKFYRPSLTAVGTTEQYYTVTLKAARVASVKVVSPTTQDPASSALPAYEEVTFIYDTINWTYGTVEHEETSTATP